MLAAVIAVAVGVPVAAAARPTALDDLDSSAARQLETLGGPAAANRAAAEPACQGIPGLCKVPVR